MPAKHFLISRRVIKHISKLPAPVQTKINNAFGRLEENPLAGFKLLGKMKYYYKYRVGDYRIVYKFDKRTKTLEILKVEHRQGVYK